ncbi:MAG TPA: hypothetical protein VMU04_20870 [Candidatus Acidoferrum sp.]|nr:hypothetical protein [Candidatus Acidoferrum sp.]
MNRSLADKPLNPSLSPSQGERLAAGRVRGDIQHPTSNIQHPMADPVALIGCWMFDVGCWMFPHG